MPREKLADIKAQRDEYAKRSRIMESVIKSLASGEVPDIEDQCVLKDGTSYNFKVFGVNRSHGGMILTACSVASLFFDSQYFEEACILARKTGYSDTAWPYRDAFDRMLKKAREIQEKEKVA